jgi:hypothetical protein
MMANDSNSSDETIADDSSPYADWKAGSSRSGKGGKSEKSEPKAAPAGHGEYDLGGEDPVEKPPIRPVTRPPVAPKRPAKPRQILDEEEEPARPKMEAKVDDIWTRGAEWGSTLMLLGLVLAATLIVAYMAADNLKLAFGIFVLGIVSVILLSYPIAITLERPVRMTPEQALKDFYAAASHHFPHYRRMWLLLSTNGRDSAEFSSFGTFRSYWKHRMGQLRSGKVKFTTPLTFDVVDYKSEKSAGQTSVEATYKVVVKARDKEEVLGEVRYDTTLVKGPDKMWYLNDGTL